MGDGGDVTALGTTRESIRQSAVGRLLGSTGDEHVIGLRHEHTGFGEVADRSSSQRPVTANDVFDLRHHLATMSASTQELFELLQEGILGLGDDVTERFLKQYIGYRRLKNFCEVVGQRQRLRVFIDGPVIDSSCIGVDVSSKGHLGTGGLMVEISSLDDIAGAMELIRQAYSLQW